MNVDLDVDGCVTGTVLIGEISKSQIQECTPALRWNGGTLQQQWKNSEYEGGHCTGVVYEWRDVPFVDNTAIMGSKG